MLILLEKIIKTNLKKDINFSIEEYIEDIFETDTNNISFKSINVFFDADNNFIFGMDIITLSWIKETISIKDYFSIYNKVSTFEKLSFVNANLSSVLYNNENSFMGYLVDNEKDINVRKAVANEIRKMENNNEGIVEEFAYYLEKLEDTNL